MRNSTTPAELRKFRATIDVIKKYAAENQFDYLMIAAQGYQESQLDQSRRSRVGAIGVMQVMPKTAADPRVNVRGIETLDNNVHAGLKYLRLLVTDYFDDPAIDSVNRQLFAFAAYNAGPSRISRLRKKAKQLGLDPNVWFNHVERVVARDVGGEPVRYVSNIYKYYLAYQQVAALDRRTIHAEGQAGLMNGPG